MGRILLAFRCFFSILFNGNISDEAASALGLSRAEPWRAAPTTAEAAGPDPQALASGGALQMLGILQRDSRLVDFLMEDISAYDDEQVGAAVRSLHEQCRQSIKRYVQLEPVIDGVEGSFTKMQVQAATPEHWPSAVKFIGNVPAGGPPEGGLLRHKGWRAARVELPPLPAAQDPAVIAPAEVEIE